MSTFTLKLYDTDFRTDEYAIYDSLDEYLQSFDSSEYITVNEFQYLKPINSLTRTIKLDINQSYYATGLRFKYNYMSATNNETGNIVYYYIMSHKWVSQNTVELELAFDYLNSYRSITKFTDNTHITRKFKNRWQKYTVGSGTSALNMIRPLIDNVPETSISNPQLWRSSVTTIKGRKWYLVYKTEYDDDNNLKKNPVSCYAIPEDKIESIGYQASTTISYDSMEIGKLYMLTEGLNNGDKVTLVTIIGEEELTLGTDCKAIALYKTSDGIFRTYYWIGSSQAYEWYTPALVTNVKFGQSSKIYVVESDNATTGLTLIDENNYVLTENEQVQMTIMPFSDWYAENKTDSTLSKIIELPYAPFNEAFNTSGVMACPEGWRLTSIGFKLIDATAFSKFIGYDAIAEPTYALSTYKATDARDRKYETKLLNSNYRVIKYVFDTQSYALMDEYLTYYSDSTAMKRIAITFKAATEMNSSIAFKFTADGMKYDTDFGEWMISTKDLSIPYYTNEYLNYLNYGQRYDWSSMTRNIISSLTSGVGSSITTGVSMANMAQKAKKAVSSVVANSGLIGGAVGLATTAVNLGTSIAGTIDAMNQKIDTYKHQSSNMSTDNALSLFNTMTSNKLLKIIYEPDEYIKNMLADFFDWYGYSCDEYGQMTDSRYWHDYYVADVEFASDCLLDDMSKKAIKQAYSDGVRIYHFRNGIYDINKSKNNTETSI